MKRFAVLTALMLAISGAALAQQTAPAADTQAPAPVTKHHTPNAGKETAKMVKDLNLTPDQTAKVEPILVDRDAKLATIKADTTLTSDERAQKMKEVRKSTSSKMHEVLTPDQENQLKESKKGKHAGASDAPPPA
jgi:protein CpxP